MEKNFLCLKSYTKTSCFLAARYLTRIVSTGSRASRVFLSEEKAALRLVNV
jgi:hypothetical protein